MNKGFSLCPTATPPSLFVPLSTPTISPQLQFLSLCEFSVFCYFTASWQAGSVPSTTRVHSFIDIYFSYLPISALWGSQRIFNLQPYPMQ